MNIQLADGRLINNKSPVSFCTGYRAKYLTMQKGDFEQLRQLAYSDPKQFNAVMTQLENRFY